MIGSLLTLRTRHSTKSSWFHPVPTWPVPTWPVPTWQNGKSYVFTSLGSKVVISPPAHLEACFSSDSFSVRDGLLGTPPGAGY